VLTPTGQTQGKRLVPNSFSETEATYSRWSQLTGEPIAPGSYDVYFEMGGYFDSKGDTGIVANHAPSPIQVR
jgi:5-hydroxyisourate hydrolase-like protein (transthyretin family)